jgi:sulfatase modifying factor 1
MSAPDEVFDAAARYRSPDEALADAERLMGSARPRLAAAALDWAFGEDPGDPRIAGRRTEVLDGLRMVEHGIAFRYVPEGTFEMGSHRGDPDEQPVHPVTLGGFWLSETPVTWAQYAALLGWSPPPRAFPRDIGQAPKMAGFHLHEANKVRLQYCESHTHRAGDWHSHDPVTQWKQGDRIVSAAELFGAPDRDDPDRPYQYNRKPMVAVSWIEAEELCAAISSPAVRYRLPTEAEWEKAARGGRRGALYPWGDEAPDPSRCDFDHFGDWVIRDPRSLPPNDYGLFGMVGGVWEWTADTYDALAYRRAAGEPPSVHELDDEPPRQRVLRGGSWADCAEVCTVSFRMSRPAETWRHATWGQHLSPTIGFRLCASLADGGRVERFVEVGAAEEEEPPLLNGHGVRGRARRDLHRRRVERHPLVD